MLRHDLRSSRQISPLPRLALPLLFGIGLVVAMAPDLAHAGAEPPSLGAPFSAPFMESLMRVPAFATRARTLSTPARRELAMTLAARGVRRLGDEALMDRATHLAILFDQIDDSLCVCLAIGTMLTSRQWEEVIGTMQRLDTGGAECANWSRAQREAVLAELAAGPVPKASPAAGGAAMHALRDLLTDGERARFDNAWVEQAPFADFAAALRMAYRHASELPSADRTALLRLLVAF
jgi:hypothetical protein